MATETLGAHLRNLLTPYCTLLNIVEEINNGTVDVNVLKKFECNNIDEIIEFSHSDKMENTLWRNENEKYDRPTTSLYEDKVVTSRMQHIDDDLKPIAEFILGYAKWNLHKDEVNRPSLEVPLFRVLDALIQRGKPYSETT